MLRCVWRSFGNDPSLSDVIMSFRWLAGPRRLPRSLQRGAGEPGSAAEWNKRSEKTSVCVRGHCTSPNKTNLVPSRPLICKSGAARLQPLLTLAHPQMSSAFFFSPGYKALKSILKPQQRPGVSRPRGAVLAPSSLPNASPWQLHADLQVFFSPAVNYAAGFPMKARSRSTRRSPGGVFLEEQPLSS